MKLTSLQEASTHASNKYPHLERAFKLAKQVKSDITLDNLAWFASFQEARLLYDSGTRDNAYIFYEGTEAYKDNPKRVNEFFATYFEDSISEPNEIDEEMLRYLKDFFQ